MSQDDVLRLMFICCHPSLTPDAQTTLTLKLVGGLTTREIARSFLTTEATVAQRVVRAKRTLADAGAALEEPDAAERADRLVAVLRRHLPAVQRGLLGDRGRRLDAAGAVRRGPAAGPDPGRAGPDRRGGAWTFGADGAADRPGWRPAPGRTASRCCSSTRIEPVGMQRICGGALMRWTGPMRCRGHDARGTYTLQAAIAACHARARTAEATDWVRIAELYEQLARITGSPVVEVNRAVALSMAYGPAAGLTLADQLVDLPALRGYHLLPSVRGDLLDKLGRHEEARVEFERAAAMTKNDRERTLLLGRGCAGGQLG